MSHKRHITGTNVSCSAHSFQMLHLAERFGLRPAGACNERRFVGSMYAPYVPKEVPAERWSRAFQPSHGCRQSSVPRAGPGGPVPLVSWEDGVGGLTDISGWTGRRGRFFQISIERHIFNVIRRRLIHQKGSENARHSHASFCRSRVHSAGAVRVFRDGRADGIRDVRVALSEIDRGSRALPARPVKAVEGDIRSPGLQTGKRSLMRRVWSLGEENRPAAKQRAGRDCREHHDCVMWPLSQRLQNDPRSTAGCRHRSWRHRPGENRRNQACR